MGVVVFLVISAGLARVLAAKSDERNRVLATVGAEARGDSRAVVERIVGCRASETCRARIAELVARLRRPGQVEVLNYVAAAGFPLGAETGPARIAWTVPGRPPVVQCLRVTHGGDVLGGLTVSLLGVGAPIAGSASCPRG